VSATKDQAAATQTADNAAIHRARRQLADDEDAKDQASDAVSALKKACKSAKAGSAAANARLTGSRSRLNSSCRPETSPAPPSHSRNSRLPSAVQAPAATQQLPAARSHRGGGGDCRQAASRR
jgi:hypothetical protein